jgi:hypothetical protein
MRRNSHIAFLSSALVISSSAAAATSAYHHIRSTLQASHNQPDVIAYDFTTDASGSVRHSTFARRLSSIYNSGIVKGDDLLSTPHEYSWDGDRLFRRSRYGLLHTRRTIGDAQPGAPTPQDYLYYNVLGAYGIINNPGLAFEFSSVLSQTDREITVSFRMRGNYNGRLEVTHALDRHCTPTRVAMYVGDTIFKEIVCVETTPVVVDGNVWHLPVKVRTSGRVRADDPLSPNLVTEVDIRSIKTGDAVRRDFTLKPWPNEAVIDEGTQKITSPVDVTWVPKEGELPFPWSEFGYYVSRDAPSSVHPVKGPAIQHTLASPSPFTLNWEGVVAAIGVSLSVFAFWKSRRTTTSCKEQR